MAFTSDTSNDATDVAQLWIDPPAGNALAAGVAVGVGRDLEALVAFCPDFERWRALTVPVTLVRCGERPGGDFDASAQSLAAVLPRCRAAVLDDREPAATAPDPNLLLDALCAALA